MRLIDPARAPLLVTLALDPAAMAELDALRRAWFPPALNIVPAHISLFHALPPQQLDAISTRLREVCADTSPYRIAFGEPRGTGNGVLLPVTAPPLLAVRAMLADSWRRDLTQQDQQGYRPHVTLQNKVDAARVRATLVALREVELPRSAAAVGLTLWRYLNGPWAHVETFAFGIA
jgi:2'-5' RNA ligase